MPADSTPTPATTRTPALAGSEAAPPSELDQALLAACYEGKAREIPVLIAGGANPNAIFEDGAGISSRRITPLLAVMRVAARGDATPKMARRQVLRLVKLLLDSGADLKQCDREMLLAAINLDSGELLAFLIDGGARVGRMARESMCVAMFGRRYEAFETLRMYGLDPNIRDMWGSTPLLELSSEHPRLAQDPEWMRNKHDELWHFRQLLQLIRMGVDIDAGDRIGATPLMRSLVAGLPALARALVRAGANPQTMLRNGVSTLHIAAACSNQDFLRFLLSNEVSFHEFRRLKSRRLQPDTRAFIASALKVEQAGTVPT